ncbi:MAG TPA: hypothetical protein VGY98_00070 [Verrucomicrobiae bacterium]|nr:hypothetical protein [Verrucomicrobiae bacterium]
MGKIARTWSLMSDCWQVLKMDKSLLLLPFISSICCFLLLASFALPVYATGAWHPPGHEAETLREVAYCGTLVLALFYFILLALINSTLHSIFQTALYLYARDGVVPQGFNADVLESALRSRTA